jgi:hypothetical protein
MDCCHQISTIIPSRSSINRKALPTRADDDLLPVARFAALSGNDTNSDVLSTSVAGGADLKRVTRVSHTIGAVGVSAPALAVEVANRGVLAARISQISFQHVFHPVSFLRGCSPNTGSSASHLRRGTGRTGQPGR